MRASVHHRIMYSSHNVSPRFSANAFAGKRKALEMRVCKLSLEFAHNKTGELPRLARASAL